MGGALAVVLLGLPAASPAPAQEGELADGNWRGSLSYTGNAELGGVGVHYDAHGSFVMNVASGRASGEWNLQVTSAIQGTTGVATATAIGTIDGSSISQELVFDRMTVVDPAFGITIEMSADELPVSGGGSLLVLNDSCNTISGSWTIPFNDSSLFGEFIAEPLVPGSASTQADLQEEGLRLIQQAADGVISPGELSSFIARAEAQAAGTTFRREGCDAETAYRFSNAATTLLDAVLVQSGFALDDADDSTFVALYRVGLRSGLFDFNPSARITWEFQLLQRLADAINSEEPSEWRFWLPVAREFGEPEAEAALEKNLCLDLHRADPFVCED